MEKLSIVLWNTKLSPPTPNRWNKSKDEHKIAVAKVILFFMMQEYDFICLTEVSPEDIKYLNSELSLNFFGYSFKYKEEHDKNLYFDTAILFRYKFLCLDMKWGVDGEEKHRIKSYQYYDFIELESSENFTFYLTHLPSLLTDNKERRRSIASYIRSDMNRLKQEDKTKKFIVLGDFNTEPYSTEIVNGLKSSRHQESVRDNTHLLYNPFWKFLPCNNDNPVGTYYYDRGEYNYWQVIDQILFSGSFLKEDWLIKDDNIEILEFEKLNLDMENPSDHLPVHAILEKKQ